MSEKFVRALSGEEIGVNRKLPDRADEILLGWN